MKSSSICKNLFNLLVFSSILFAPACSDSGKETKSTIKGVIVKCDSFKKLQSDGSIDGYNEFDALETNFTKAQMDEEGFVLGDELTVTIGDWTMDMPYFDGFYNRTGEYLVVAYPTYKTIVVTRNNMGMPKELMDKEGEKISIDIKNKGTYLPVQEALGMKYTNNREDYATDCIYANERVVNIGSLAKDRLYRSASPFDNQANRASYASALMEQNGIGTVLNLSDTEAKILSYNLPPFSKTMWDNGNVILCPLKSDPTAVEYNDALVAALKTMSTRKGPYLIHCVEGKDRTGYVCALLEGLCGATYKEIVDDYLITYDNYYGVNPKNKPDVCNTLVSLRLDECLMHYAGVGDSSELKNCNFSETFSRYLLSHGMSAAELGRLIDALTK
ncbi:MAG: tyrosine-protein phosphatase [Bacteroidales bacterium]|nr:tyrosine-protein phosphatase [Bacteroidales bacterium]